VNKKTVVMVLVAVLVAGSGLLSACGSATPTSAPPQEAADGMALLEERCTECHDLQRVVNTQKDRAGWEETVDRMIRRGADLNTEERDVLVDYLAQTYGP
jgi:cytochrome c5